MGAHHLKQNGLLSRSPRVASIIRSHGLLYVDQMVSSGTNAVILLLAARVLSSKELSVFAFETLIILGFGSLQRAALTSPAMVTQRQVGKARLPFHWVLFSSTVLALASLFVVLAAGQSMGIAGYSACSLVVVTTFVVCLQDGLRYWAISSGNVRSALIGDAVWAISIMMTFLTTVDRSSGSFLVLLLTAVGACLGAVAIILSNRRRVGQFVHFRATWRLGRWGGVTSALTTTGIILPLAMATHSLSDGVAGVYRTLQTVQGPLNVFATSIAVTLASSAWKYSGRTGVVLLQNTIKWIALCYGGFCVVYLVVGELCVVWLTGINLDRLTYIPIVVVMGGLLAAPTGAFSSGSLVLGRQKAGTICAVVVFVLILVVTLMAEPGRLGGRFDPVAVTTLTAGTVSLVWWATVFKFAVRREVMSRG